MMKKMISRGQLERRLHYLSPFQYWLSHFRYRHNMRYAMVKIQKAVQKGLSVCYLEYRRITTNEAKDVIARLNYLGYTVNSVYIPYGTSLTASFWVRFDNDEEGIDYVSY